MRRFGSVITGIALVATSLALLSAPAQASAPSCAAATGFAGGDGASSGTAFQISTPAQLQYLLNLDYNATNGKFYKLTADIDFAGCELSHTFSFFGGTFNGDGKVVSNFVDTIGDYNGLFSLTSGGALLNLVIDNANVTGGNRVGALAGGTQLGTAINNIQVRNSTVTGNNFVGGAVGSLLGGGGNTVADIRVINSSVTGQGDIGGVAGAVSGYTTINRLGAFGTTVARTGVFPAQGIGGVIGQIDDNMGNHPAVSLNDTGFRGFVNAGSGVTNGGGLLIGRNANVTMAATNVYAVGTISAGPGSDLAGLVGGSVGVTNFDRAYVRAKFVDSSNGTTALSANPFKSGPGTLNVAYLDTTIHNNWTSVPAGVGRTTQELKTATTYVNFAYTTGTAAVAAGSIGNSGWYFSNVIDGGFMALMWEYWGKPIVPCPIGKYSFNGIENCTNAAPGTYVAATGSFASTDCPAGTYQASFGAGDCTPAAAGSFVSDQRQVASMPCPPGTYQPSMGQVACINASPGFFATGPGAATQTQCASGTTSQAQATVCTAVAQYSGPRLNGTRNIASPGKVVKLSGANLESVSSAAASGKPLEVLSKTESSISLRLPTDAVLGIQDLVLTSNLGVVTIQGALRVVHQTAIDSSANAVSIKRIGNRVRLFATDVVGAGKIQFKINGKEVGWVRAVDETNPKLRNANGRAYFVRLAGLASGKNAVEIYVDGTRVKRVAYTR